MAGLRRRPLRKKDIGYNPLYREAILGSSPFMYGVGSKDAVPADFPKKNFGPPLKGSLYGWALGPVTGHCGVPQWP